MGGTFDPIHIAHLVAASEVCETLKLDQIIFIPAGQPWQKAETKISAGEVRLQMVEAAISEDSRFSASDIELKRTGNTYAIDTVQQLLDENPSNQYFWIVGADALAGMPTWHKFEELKELIEIVGVNRNGVGQVDVGFDYKFVEIPEIKISATEIRERIKSGKSVKYLVPSSVEHLIGEQGLYK